MADTLDLLLMARDEVLQEIKDARARLDDIEGGICVAMREEGAEERTVGDRKVVYRRAIEWNKDALTPLLEELPLELLNGAYTAAQWVESPPKWDASKVKPLTRYSAEAKRIIEGAQSLGPWTLKVVKA